MAMTFETRITVGATQATSGSVQGARVTRTDADEVVVSLVDDETASDWATGAIVDVVNAVAGQAAAAALQLRAARRVGGAS